MQQIEKDLRIFDSQATRCDLITLGQNETGRKKGSKGVNGFDL